MVEFDCILHLFDSTIVPKRRLLYGFLNIVGVKYVIPVIMGDVYFAQFLARYVELASPTDCNPLMPFVFENQLSLAQKYLFCLHPDGLADADWLAETVSYDPQAVPF